MRLFARDFNLKGKMRKISLITFCLASLLLVSWGQKTCLEKNNLVIGTNAEFPPFTYREKDEIVGFDIDIAKEVCQRLGRKGVFKDMPFEALIPDLMVGSVDFIAAGMSYTEERAKRVSFTSSYLEGDPLVIFSLEKNKVLNLEGLKGKKVVVNEGFTADTFISSQQGFEVVRLPTTADAFLSVKNGRAYAFITAMSTVQDFFNKQGSASFHIAPIVDTAETCALVVSQKNPQLLSEIQQALEGMKEDGTLVKLKEKWKLK